MLCQKAKTCGPFFSGQKSCCRPKCFNWLGDKSHPQAWFGANNPVRVEFHFSLWSPSTFSSRKLAPFWRERNAKPEKRLTVFTFWKGKKYYTFPILNFQRLDGHWQKKGVSIERPFCHQFGEEVKQSCHCLTSNARFFLYSSIVKQEALRFINSIRFLLCLQEL